MRYGFLSPITKISGLVLASPFGNKLPSGIEYVPSSFTRMRKIFPRRSFEFPADLLASYCIGPGLSFNGAKPLLTYLTPGSSNGVELSPVDKYKRPSGPNAIEPPVWQHISRCACTSRITFSEAMLIESFSNVKRDKRFTELS